MAARDPTRRLCGTLLVRIGEQRRRDRDHLAQARDEAAEFRGAFFKSQATQADLDKERAAQAATLQQLATHVSERAAADLDQQKLMDELRKKIDAKEGDVSSGGGIVTVHLADEILFASGEAELSKQGDFVLGRLGDVFKSLTDKQILVGGHTDDAPIHTARFPSNWELSTARAVNVVHFLVDKVGVDPRKLTAAGYSQYHPRGSRSRAEPPHRDPAHPSSAAAPSAPPSATAPGPGAGSATSAKRREMKRRSGLVLGARQRRAIGGGRLVAAAEPAQQIGARGVEQVIVGELRRPSASTSASPAAGPSAIATATAWLSATTGDGMRAPAARRRARRSARQSVSSARAALGVQRGDRRLQRVRARPPRAQRARARARALVDLRRDPSARGPDPRAARDRRRVGARVAPRVVQQHQREQAVGLRGGAGISSRASGRAGSPRRTARAAPARRRRVAA